MWLVHAVELHCFCLSFVSIAFAAGRHYLYTQVMISRILGQRAFSLLFDSLGLLVCSNINGIN